MKKIIALLILSICVCNVIWASDKTKDYDDFVFVFDESTVLLYINKLGNAEKGLTLDEMILFLKEKEDNVTLIPYCSFNEKAKKNNELVQSAFNPKKNSLLLRHKFSFMIENNGNCCFLRYLPANSAWYPRINSTSGEFVGSYCNIWLIPSWHYIENAFNTPGREIIFSASYSRFNNNDFTSLKNLDSYVKNNHIFIINLDSYKKILSSKNELKIEEKPYYSKTSLGKWNNSNMNKVKELLVESSQPISSDTSLYVKSPIMLVDEKNHKHRADSEDWRIYSYMNDSNGDFFQYFFFETELDQEWPLYIRDFALDHLAGAHICKKSTVLVNKKSHEKVFKQGHMRGNNPKDVYIHKTKGKQWRPAPVPKDKNTIPKDRLFFDREPGRIFGSYAKVWELDVWQMLPNMLRDNPEGVYLVGYGTLLHLNECKTPYEEQALLKKCGVLITPQIYKELQSLHRLEQSQSPPTKK